jgi:hypothetical protein
VAPAVVALALIYAFPKAAYTWAGIVFLGPVALVAALTALRT